MSSFLSMLNTFQMKGIRKILHRLTTFGQMQQGLERTNSTEEILKELNYRLTFNRPGAQPVAIMEDNPDWSSNQG